MCVCVPIPSEGAQPSFHRSWSPSLFQKYSLSLLRSSLSVPLPLMFNTQSLSTECVCMQILHKTGPYERDVSPGNRMPKLEDGLT